LENTWTPPSKNSILAQLREETNNFLLAMRQAELAEWIASTASKTKAKLSKERQGTVEFALEKNRKG
jgi:hypothetical protein